MELEIKGKVIHGSNLGKKLGFSTANLEIDNSFDLKFGVYKVFVVINNNEYLGVANFGINPTCNKITKPRLEVHILDFNQNIYDNEIKVKIVKFLRPEIKFNNKEELIKQINNDVKNAREND